MSQETYYSRRTDHAMKNIVNQGISYQEIYGTPFAAAYMSTQGVNIEVALRVLSRPWQRRKC